MYPHGQEEMSKVKSLEDYFGRHIKIIDVDGKEWHGRVTDYTSAADNETDGIAEESITCRMDGVTNGLIEFFPGDVVSIEVEK